MAAVLIVAYLLIVVALIAVILIQRSEGGGLGLGTANSNGLVSVRGSANLLTRTTAILAALFFATAIALTILAELDRSTQSILDRAQQQEPGSTPPATVLDALKQLDSQSGGTATPAPATDAAPAAPAAADPAIATPASEAPAATPAPDAATTSTMAPATDAAPADSKPAAPAAGTTEQPATGN
jgi:preprotein translocase subunit SecG